MEVFVPGRVCVLGEHSDWAGKFRSFNPALSAGATIVTGTNQGLFARVAKHASKLIVTSCDNQGRRQRAEIPMDARSLLEVARQGGHWAYVAGVAFKMLEEHTVGGIEIDNYRTTLPLKKGLSSSAAICVLTARAFNKLYDLRLTPRGEMEYAYQGELVTPSQCGRLDQACAFGSTPVLMTYDGEFTTVERITMAVELHFVIVDLCAAKDTVQILEGLQSAYPKAQNDLHRGLQRCLGELNKDITTRALDLLSGKDPSLSSEEIVARVGALLNEAQANFDELAAPLCPAQLRAPVLHKCLEFPALQPYIVGGKMVGAGGDGTAQLLCKSADAANEVARIVKDELKMDPLLLTISPGSKIQTAVIPAGGFAGMLFPASQACKAELFPILDPSDGILKPLILGTVEQLLQAGLERIVLVVQEDDLGQFERLFKQAVTPANAQHLPEGNLEAYSKRLIDIGRRVEFVVQEQQWGFGHAVYCARDKVGSVPFLLVLGHHVYVANKGAKTCAEQVLDAHRFLGTSVVGLKQSNVREVSKFGTVSGSFRPGPASFPLDVVSVTAVVEKPTPEFAQANLHVPSLPDDTFLTMFGIYALDANIFELLEHDVQHNIRTDRGDIAFSPALDRLRQNRGLSGLVIDGERFPIHSPETFINANAALLEKHKNAQK
ncbi:UTP--glucose-1-phosphate uridylyltransferase (Alpha-D-glucosyl-1-phosphate uridylyltransferase) (UDP-glucose pyrophosphorylase) (UDPGP) (Uridine diphosphoglucose pyrophosphorylase) [Durusdinium trenchii]|uniref:UTP--glucose-1-phosphate uridylyltransferase n=1 Tax=Durusdinium trenchii TaxID=1381693 RepID=A0ABP0K4E6_9DINO